MTMTKRVMAQEILDRVHENYNRSQKNTAQELPREIAEKEPEKKYKPSKSFQKIFSKILGDSQDTGNKVNASEGFDVKPERVRDEDKAVEVVSEMLEDRSCPPQPGIVAEPVRVEKAACVPAYLSVFERVSKAIETKDGAHEGGGSPEEERPTEQEEAPAKTPVSVFEKLSRKGNGS